MPSPRRDDPDGHIPVYWLNTTLEPTRWERLSRRWINLPAALITVLVVVAILVPMPAISIPRPSMPSLPSVSLPSVSIPAPAVALHDGDGNPSDDLRMDLATPRPVLASLLRSDYAAEATGDSLPDLATFATHPPNELGHVPILMYHAFVTDPAYTDEWTITLDQFRDQLDWLREHDFVMVGMRSMVTGRFDVPAGKKPAILTFDDASAGQFGLREATGGYEVNPDTAVGVLEAYAKEHPDFAGPAFFAVLPFNCFASEGDPSSCEERLNWLVDHDYEIGNHTADHVSLADVAPDFFTKSIGSMELWINDRVPQGKGNLADVLVLPFGAYPDIDLHPDQRSWLYDGFWYLGDPVNLDLVVAVNGGPAISPYSTKFSMLDVYRFNTTPDLFAYYADQMVSGEISIFVSDGDPETVTVPADLEQSVNLEMLRSTGLGLEVYKNAKQGG